MQRSLEPTISVVVPVYNGGEDFRQCLASLSGTNPPPDELVVIDDGSTDSSAAIAREYGARVLSVPKSDGRPAVRNIGAEATTCDVILFVDADVTVMPDIILRVRRTFQYDPGLAAVFGSYDDTPARKNFLSQYRNLFHHHIHQTAREEATTFFTGIGAIRREVLVALGGFNEAYPFLEDIELGYRMTLAGHKIRLDKDLQVKHLKHWGLFSTVYTDIFNRALWWTRLILRDRLFVNDLNLKFASRASVAITFTLLACLVVALWWPFSLAIAAALAVVLLALNAPIYAFFWQKRDAWFTIRAVLWHWFYYFYSGIGFGIGVVRYGIFKAK